MTEKIENLRWAVLEKGQKNKDRTKMSRIIIRKCPEGVLQYQMVRDFQAEYKFYDALTMWLGQSQYWSDDENAYLVSLAKTYLTKVENKKGG